MRYWYYVSTSQQNGHRFGVARTPTLWAAWEDICEWVCTKVFRDRWCHRIAGPAVTAAHNRTERFDEVLVSEDWARRYYAWRGMNAWWVDEDET